MLCDVMVQFCSVRQTTVFLLNGLVNTAQLHISCDIQKDTAVHGHQFHSRVHVRSPGFKISHACAKASCNDIKTRCRGDKLQNLRGDKDNGHDEKFDKRMKCPNQHPWVRPVRKNHDVSLARRSRVATVADTTLLDGG